MTERDLATGVVEPPDPALSLDLCANEGEPLLLGRLTDMGVELVPILGRQGGSALRRQDRRELPGAFGVGVVAGLDAVLRPAGPGPDDRGQFLARVGGRAARPERELSRGVTVSDLTLEEELQPTILYDAGFTFVTV